MLTTALSCSKAISIPHAVITPPTSKKTRCYQLHFPLLCQGSCPLGYLHEVLPLQYTGSPTQNSLGSNHTEHRFGASPMHTILHSTMLSSSFQAKRPKRLTPQPDISWTEWPLKCLELRLLVLFRRPTRYAVSGWLVCGSYQVTSEQKDSCIVQLLLQSATIVLMQYNGAHQANWLPAD